MWNLPSFTPEQVRRFERAVQGLRSEQTRFEAGLGGVSMRYWQYAGYGGMQDPEFRRMWPYIQSAADIPPGPITRRVSSGARTPLIKNPNARPLPPVTHSTVGLNRFGPLGRLRPNYPGMRGGQSQVFGDRPVFADEPGVAGYDKLMAARSETALTPEGGLDEEDFLRRIGLGRDISKHEPLDLSRLYDYYSSSGLQARQEIGGYSVAGGGEVPAIEIFGEAINLQREAAGNKVRRLHRLLEASRGAAQRSEGWRSSNAIWENEIRPLEMDLAAAEDEFRAVERQRAVYTGDHSLGLDVNINRQISRVKGALDGAIDRSMSDELQRKIKAIRDEAQAEYGYPTMRTTPEGLRVGEQRVQEFLKSEQGGAFFDVIDRELSKRGRFAKRMTERSAAVEDELRRGTDLMYELFATGGLPTPAGPPPSALIPLPSGPMAGHQVQILEALNPNNIRIGRGGVIENLPTGMEGPPGIGFRYRPASAPVEEHLMSQIGLTELERSTPPAPLLRAFETTATSPLLLEDAKEARKDFLRWAGLENEVGKVKGRRVLEKAIGEVDRQYSQRIYGRMLGSVPSEEARAAYTTATRLDSLTGRVGDKTMQEVFGRLLAEGEEEITPARAAAEIIAGTLFTPMDKTSENAADRLMQLPGERAASETIDKLGRLGQTTTEWTTERYGDAVIQLLGNPNDPFAKQVRELLNVSVPGMRDLEWKKGVHKRFRSLVHRNAEDSFGVRAVPQKRGRLGAREAEVKREVSRTRAREMADPRLQTPISFGSLVYTNEEGEEVASRGLLRAEQRLFDQSDVNRPDDVVRYLGQQRFARAQEIREDVALLTDIRVRQDQLKFLMTKTSDVGAQERYARALKGVTQRYERLWAEIHGKGGDYGAEFDRLWARTVPTIVKARTIPEVAQGIAPTGKAAQLTTKAEMYERVVRGESPGFDFDRPEYAAKAAEAREQLRLIGRFHNPAGQADAPVAGIRRAQFVRQEAAKLRGRGVDPELARRMAEARWTQYERPAGVPRNVMMEEITALQNQIRMEDLRDESGITAGQTAARMAKRFKEEGVFIPEEDEGIFYSALQNVHGWDDYTTRQLRAFLQGEKSDLFFGGEPETILETLEAGRAAGTHYAMPIPGFAENYRRVTGRRPSRAMDKIHVTIQDLFKLGDETEALSAQNVAVRFDVLGTMSGLGGEEQDRVAIQAALNLPRYEQALTGSYSPISVRGRQEIMKMARAELDALGGVPQMTWQLRYSQLGVAPSEERRAELMKSQMARIRQLRDRGASVNKAYDWNALAEQSDLSGFGRYEVVPNSELLDVVQPAQYMHIRAGDIAKFTSANTVTSDRNTVNRAIAEEAILFRRPAGIFQRKRDIQIRAMQITNPEIAPTNPLTGKGRLTEFYNPIVSDIDKELQTQGLSWDLVTKVSSAFEDIKGGVKGLDLSEKRSDLPEAVRLRSRKALGMAERGEFSEQYFLSPLAAGRFVRTGESGGNRMYDLFAKALWQKDMPEEEIHGYARAFGIDTANITSRDDLLTHLASQGWDLRSENVTKMIAQHLGEQTHALMQPEVLRDVLSQEQYRPVGEAIWNHVMSGMVAPTGETGTMRAVGEVADQAAGRSEQILRSDIYKRINFGEISRLWRENRVFRGGAIAAGAIGTIGVVSSFRKRKDRTEDDVRGPKYQPGGGPYDRVPPRPGMTSTGYGYQQQPGGGTTYYVNARGGQNPRDFQNQVSGVTGAPVSGTIYDSSPAYDPSKRADDVMNSYG